MKERDKHTSNTTRNTHTLHTRKRRMQLRIFLPIRVPRSISFTKSMKHTPRPAILRPRQEPYHLAQLISLLSWPETSRRPFITLTHSFTGSNPSLDPLPVMLIALRRRDHIVSRYGCRPDLGGLSRSRRGGCATGEAYHVWVGRVYRHDGAVVVACLGPSGAASYRWGCEDGDGGSRYCGVRMTVFIAGKIFRVDGSLGELTGRRRRR